jgi:hypothetical protein
LLGRAHSLVPPSAATSAPRLPSGGIPTGEKRKSAFWTFGPGYAADSGPGQASGQGENLSGGRWWVVAASGSQIRSGGGDSDGDSGDSSDEGY